MNKKLLNLVKKNNLNELNNEVYGSEVNAEIQHYYKYGEEQAIIRKTLKEVIRELEKLGIDSSIFQEFNNYYEFAEKNKKDIKDKLYK